MEAAALGILTSSVTEAVKCLIAPLGLRIDHLFHCKRNLQVLINKADQLEMMRNGVERSIQRARREGGLIKPVVEAWLANVITIQNETMTLKGEAEQINSSCFKGWWFSRYHLGKEANSKIGTVNKLLQDGQSFSSTDTVSDPAPTPTIESLPTADFQTFASRDSVTKQIVGALKDEKINVVGVYGMGGVGKTTLMKEVAKRMKIDQLFDEVVMVTVSQEQSLNKIQSEIAEKLGMRKLEEVSDFGRAGRLSTRLKDEKRALIILDDLWQRLDLAMVGIPFGDDHKACKIIITTRNLDVCNHMEAQEKIELKDLSEQDSWNLFRQKAGDVVDSPKIQALAWKVAKECRGLPLAIVTCGLALRDKDHNVWKDAAQQLRKSIFFQGKSPVFSSVKLSYDYLDNEEIKQCLLFCSFFPENYNIDEEKMMWYVMGEELLTNVDTLEEARGRLHTMLDKLIASCLLIKGYKDGYVMIHDVVRDAVLSIASEESKEFIIKSGLGLRQWPEREIVRSKCKRISLMRNEINGLPEQPECPQLLTLSLTDNYYLKKFPDHFFEMMTSLVTLDLGYTGLSSLPLSLSCLVNLRTLCLNGNSLRDISSVGKLKKLEILSLSKTKIQRLPEEMGGLTNLRLLDLSETGDLEIIPQSVLSSLSHLEELHMMNSFEAWEIQEIEDGSNARLAELASLNCLTTLHLCVDNVKCLSAEISICWENLSRFCINVTGKYFISSYSKAMSLTTTQDPLSNWVKMLLKRTEELNLYHCEDLKSVLNLEVGRFNNLKSLNMVQCNEMQYLMKVFEENPQTAFSGLEELLFYEMKCLEAIYHGSLPNGFLGKLRILVLFSCKKVINVVPCDLLARLQNLEELEVIGCDELKEVFQSAEGLGEWHAVIPKLRVMRLTYLPELTTIWKGVIPLVSFQELIKMEVGFCGRLCYLFSRAMVQRLQKLEVLEIWSCSEMTEIIKSEGSMLEEDKTLLPRLIALGLYELPMLSSFYQGRLIFDLPSLESLEVLNCPNFNKLPLGPQSAPNLRLIVGDNAEWLEGVRIERPKCQVTPTTPR